MARVESGIAAMRRPLLLLILALSASLGFGKCHHGGDPDGRVIHLEAASDLEFQLREAFMTARPGDTIVLPRGTFAVTDQLSLDVSHVTLKGRGMYETVLNFGGTDTGAEGILVTADAFTAMDLAIEDTAGDGIKIEGADGVRFIRTRVEWTNGPATDNGAYGFYPVQCRNVLVEGSVVIGASDAGIYVGQSENIIVRYNVVKQNVAGVEIENSKHADVHGNFVSGNTGGVLVFDLPNLSVQGGQSVRVYQNIIVDNNTPNFAAPGNTVALVPAGTGLMVMANDDIEVFGNIISDHGTANTLVVSYLVTFIPITDPDYDPWPERISIHDNWISQGGYAPDGLGAIAGALFAPDPIPDIVWDGLINPALDDGTGHLPPDLNICVRNNPGAGFGSLGGLIGPVSTDPTPHDCAHPRLAKIVLEDFPPKPEPDPEYTEAEIEALCTAPGSDVNWDAFVVDCPVLSDYRLFLGGAPGTHSPNGGVPFDLTTPLFSDYALKNRFVFLPDGDVATYDADLPFDFPVGTVITKTFSFPDDMRDPSLGGEVVETRLLIHRADGWVGRAYIHDASLGEAFLAVGGGIEDVSFIDPSGVQRDFTYRVPNINECSHCHGTDEGAAPIGPKARLLNRELDYGGGVVANQIDHWSDIGLLMGAPDSSLADRLPVWNDPADGTRDERARAYLESNCAHCHSATGRARFTSLFLDIDSAGTSLGICKPPVAAGPGSGGRQYDIVPGAPDDSILVLRIESLIQAIRMPELLKSVVHDEGVALVRDWITNDVAGSCGP